MSQITTLKGEVSPRNEYRLDLYDDAAWRTHANFAIQYSNRLSILSQLLNGTQCKKYEENWPFSQNNTRRKSDLATIDSKINWRLSSTIYHIYLSL